MSHWNLDRRGIRDARVLDAMRSVPRERFVPEHQASQALGDFPLPIGHGQTISQPYIVAVMTELLALQPEHCVLEIGTGSGYQTAILAKLAKHVYSVELVRALHERASNTLRTLGVDNISLRLGDGYQGWPEHAPFDAVILTAAPPEIPEALVDQLAQEGRLVAPVGPQGQAQELVLVERDEDGVKRRRLMAVSFVPMVHPQER